MRVVNALFVIVILATGAFADTTWVSDTVSGTWTSAGNPYILTGNCYVADAESLFIEEGVRIIAEDSSQFILSGNDRFFLYGSPSEPINITRVCLSRARTISYCVIDSCATAVSLADSIKNTIIGYSGIGIRAEFKTYCVNSVIHNCDYGSYCAIDAEIHIERCVFHHNHIGTFSGAQDECEYYAKTYINYCTYSNNEISLFGETDFFHWDPHPPEYFHSWISAKNSIIADTTNGYGHIYWSYYPEPLPNCYMHDPCFTDTAESDYSLLESSPYIDFGHDDSVYGGFNGLRPDLGGLESPYTSTERCRFYPEVYIVDDFPAVTLGDTSEYTVRIINIGPSPADSIQFDIESPFLFLNISDSTLPPHEFVSLTFGYIFSFSLDSLNSTAYMKWFSGDTS